MEQAVNTSTKMLSGNCHLSNIAKLGISVPSGDKLNASEQKRMRSPSGKERKFVSEDLEQLFRRTLHEENLLKFHCSYRTTVQLLTIAKTLFHCAHQTNYIPEKQFTSMKKLLVTNDLLKFMPSGVDDTFRDPACTPEHNVSLSLSIATNAEALTDDPQYTRKTLNSTEYKTTFSHCGIIHLVCLFYLVELFTQYLWTYINIQLEVRNSAPRKKQSKALCKTYNVWENISKSEGSCDRVAVQQLRSKVMSSVVTCVKHSQMLKEFCNVCSMDTTSLWNTNLSVYSDKSDDTFIKVRITILDNTWIKQSSFEHLPKLYSQIPQSLNGYKGIFEQKEIKLSHGKRPYLKTADIFTLRRRNMPRQNIIAFPFASLQPFFQQLAINSEVSKEEEMRYEGRRLQSFEKFPSPVSAIRLSQAGMYFTGQGDETVCYSCDVRHRNWTLHDNPMQVHRRLSPSCRHVCAVEDKNVPIGSGAGVSHHSAVTQTVEEDNLGASYASSQGTATSSPQTNNGGYTSLLTQPDCIRMMPSGNMLSTQRAYSAAASHQLSVNSLDYHKAIYPQYRDIRARMSSFTNWPQHMTQRPVVLVQAGLFYAGYADCVRCFYCGICLKTWEPQDDPWLEHLRWRPSCDFLKCVKGEEFVRQTLASIGKAEQTQLSFSTPDTPQLSCAAYAQNIAIDGEEGLMKNEAVLKAVEMGFDQDVIKQVANSILSKKGLVSLKLEILLEGIFSMRDKRQTSTNVKSVSIDSAIADGQNSMHSSDDHSDNESDSVESEGYLSLESSVATNPSPVDPCVDSVKTTPKPDSQLVDNLNNPTVVTVGSVLCHATRAKSTFDKSDSSKETSKNVVRKKKAKETAQKKNRQLKEDNQCRICFDRPINVVFLPCGHYVACAECSPALRKCPICRRNIRGSVRATMSSTTYSLLEM